VRTCLAVEFRSGVPPYDILLMQVVTGFGREKTFKSLPLVMANIVKNSRVDENSGKL